MTEKSKEETVSPSLLYLNSVIRFSVQSQDPSLPLSLREVNRQEA